MSDKNTVPEIPDISIIIVNWNSKEYLRKCLEKLRFCSRGIRLQTIVIDSGSFDGSEEMVGSGFPEVTFIQSQENLGFPRGNNVAASEARGAFVLLLNPDTEPEPDALKELLSAAQSLPEVGIVGAHLLNTDGSVQTSSVQALPTILGELLNTESLRRRFPHAKIWGMAPLWKSPRVVSEVEMISGACMLLARNVFEKVGRFSTDYFMYVEDADLCYKVRREGLRNYYVPSAVIIHHGGGSSRQVSGFAAAMRSESLRRYFRKWHGPVRAIAFRLAQGGAAIFRLALLATYHPGSPEKARSRSASWRKWMAVAAWAFGLKPPAKPQRTRGGDKAGTV